MEILGEYTEFRKATGGGLVSATADRADDPCGTMHHQATAAACRGNVTCRDGRMMYTVL